MTALRVLLALPPPPPQPLTDSIASSLKVVLAVVLPIQHVLPSVFIQNLIGDLTNPSFKPVEYNELLAEVRQVKADLRAPPARFGAPGGTTMIVGHSLGGCYTNIVGALGEIPTFALSPPGLFYGIRKFGINKTADLYPYLQTIRPDFDPVPLADWQVGAVQNIPCTAVLDGLGSHIKCHSADRTLAMLAAACPDVTHPGRQWGIFVDADEDAGTEKKTLWTKAGLADGTNTMTVPEGWSGRL